jgi:hypothetical protein
MEKSQGQRYIANLFFAGISSDVSPELSDSKSGTVIESHGMGISRLFKNILRVFRGDKSFVSVTAPSATISFIGGVWLEGYVVTMYRDTVALLTYIYANGVLIAQNADLPKQYCDIDSNSETLELYITDNLTVPIVLNLQDMLDNIDDETYFTEYNVKLYSVNKPLQLNQPVFVQLEDLGAGAGLRFGSYAYSMCYASASGESTPWGPVSPYIPVPESAVALNVNTESFTSGLKTWGGETSLTPGRYGIRLKLRVANVSGFDYIKIKRLANNTGQPISYTPTAEFMILTTGASGELIDPKVNPYDIVEFVDSDSKDWVILDDSVFQVYSTIKTARTIRYFDRRIVLGGIEYESKLLDDKNIFITETGANRIAFPIVKQLETGVEARGFSNIFNQVYNKSHRLGEKYGFGAKLYDEQGNTLFTVPLKREEAKDDFTNFQFPNRRDPIPTDTKRVDAVYLSGTIGSATITVGGVAGVAVFHDTIENTVLEFVAEYVDDYAAVDILLTSFSTSLLFTSTVAGVNFDPTDVVTVVTIEGGDLTGSVVTSTPNVVPIRQVSLIMLNQTVSSTITITCNVAGVGEVTRTTPSGLASVVVPVFVANADVIAAFAAIGCVLSRSLSGDANINVTGPENGDAVTITASGGLYASNNPVQTTVTPVVGTMRMDRISVFATNGIGAATIHCNGGTGILTWRINYATTFSDFITAYGSSFPNVTVTSSTIYLYFTSTVPGNFSETTTITPILGGNLYGTVVHTRANVLPVRQTDVVLFNNTGGVSTITCNYSGGVATGTTRSTAGTGNQIAAWFYTDWVSYFAARGLLLSVVATGYGGISITGPVDGSTMSTTATGARIQTAGLITTTGPQVGVKRVDTLYIESTETTYRVGSITIRCNGGVGIWRWHIDFATSMDEFQALYNGSFPGVVVTHDSAAIIFTAAVAGVDFTEAASGVAFPTSNLSGTVGHTQANVLGNPSKDTVVFKDINGSCTINLEVIGGGTHEVTRTAASAALMMAAFLAEENSSHGWAAIGVSIAYGGEGAGSIKLTGPGGYATTVIGSGTSYDHTTHIQDHTDSVAQIETLTLTGTSGNAWITCGAATKPVTFISSLANAATAFDTDYSASYTDVAITTSGADIIFTANVAGVGFTAPSIITVPHNMYGRNVLTTANQAAAPQVDTLYLRGYDGTADITCEGVTRTATYATDLSTTASNFVTANLAAYAAVSVVVSSVGGTIIFTGTGGATITTTATGTLVDGIYILTLPSLGIAQIDTITLVGSSGNMWITCNAMRRGITYSVSLLHTASKFYDDFRAVYAEIGIAVTLNGINLVFTALTAGNPFIGATTAPNAITDITGLVDVYAPVIAVAQVDVVTMLGSDGTATITCAVTGGGTVTKSVTYNTSLEVTAQNFYNNWYSYYAAIGVTVSYTPSGTIVFTGPAIGTAITTTATGTLVDAIYTTTTGVLGTAQVDTITLTGASGELWLICNGIRTGVSYITSPTLTASRFVDWNADAYLPEVEVTSSGADVIFTVADIYKGLVTLITTIEAATGAELLDGAGETVTPNATGGGEGDASPVLLTDSTVDSYAGEDYAKVYDPVMARRTVKVDSAKEINIVSKGDPDDTDIPIPYAPVTPTGRGGRINENNYEGISKMYIMDTVDSHSTLVGQYGTKVSTIGLRIGGIDTTKLPPSVKSFSIVRTPAAGRVVCQGIGMYALTEQVGDDPSLVKALDKLWFYSPELDSVIGTKNSVYEDIKTNPGAYQIQLVAPCGFFSDFYNAMSYGHEEQQDFVSMPICGAGVDAMPMFPPDHAATNYISFGKWRNTAAQGAGLVSSDLTFDISSAQDVPHGKIRVPYLELALSTNIYASTDVKPEASSTAQSIAFHEPWYIINIIQNKDVPNNNINVYNDIGHSIRLESIVGISNGEASQTFPLVEERSEDVYSLNDTATTYRYIYVDGDPWLDSNNLTDIATYLTTLEASGSFTPTDGLECFGIYTYDSDINAITFDQVLPGSLAPVVPVSGSQIVVKYNNNSPIEVFLGDTYVADASFLAVDVANYDMPEFRLKAPMPHYNFEFKTTYHQAYAPEAGVTHANIWEDQGTHTIYDIRQWLVVFTCESTVNLSLAYKNFFPNKLYAMRPAYFPSSSKKLETETISEFFTRMNIYPQYNDDYPDEYLNWWYGGLSTPASVNYDYEKLLSLKSYAEPKSGANEILSYKKRYHWSTQNMPGYNANKVFIPTNIYDLKNDKASQISITYDQFSERGSNLYTITDRGAGMLLTDKQMITTAEGNNLAILAADSSLIKGEVWLNGSIGCPKEFWRGKSEGSVKLPNNIVASILVFPSQNDIMMLTNNNFVQIADNNREAIVNALELVDLTGDFITKLHSVIDEGENRLWITIGDNTYSFNFDQNNWDGHINELIYDKSFNAKYLEGVSDRNVLVHAVNGATQFGLSMSHKYPTRFTAIGELPYVVFSVTPGLGQAYEFLDMFLSTSFAPYSVEVATDKLFTDSAIIPAAKLIAYNSGWYYINRLPRTTVGDSVLIGKTLFVKVTFPDNNQWYDLRFTKIGYKQVTGG